MKVELDLYSVHELDLFGDFLKACAANVKARAAEIKTDRAEPAETPDASHIEPTVPEPAPEKKTRKKRGEAAPVVSAMSTDNDGQTDIEDAIAAAPAISTGEERVGPEDPPEDVAQDAADEAAETEAARDPEKPLTLDDVRVAMGGYVNKFGMAAAQSDGPKIFEKALGEVPAGTKNSKGDVVETWTLTAIPTDQSALSKAVQYWTAAATENPFGHKAAA